MSGDSHSHRYQRLHPIIAKSRPQQKACHLVIEIKAFLNLVSKDSLGRNEEKKITNRDNGQILKNQNIQLSTR